MKTGKMRIKEIVLASLLIFSLSSMAQKISVRKTNDSLEQQKIDEKIVYYNKQKDTVNWIKYTVKKINKYGLDTAGLGRVFTNNMIYNLIFMYSNDKIILNKSAKWMKVIMDSEQPTPEHIDTYANLLYKLNRKTEAIKWQEQAVQLSPDDKGMQDTLDKMKKDIPTWIVNN